MSRNTHIYHENARKTRVKVVPAAGILERLAQKV